MRLSAPLVFAAALSLVAALAVAVGLLLIGSPAHIRVLRLDEQRVSELTSLANSIASYRRSHNKLPDKLEELAQSAFWLPTLRHGPYEYRPTGTFTYQLCADFGAASDDFPPPADRLAPWAHSRGHFCFTREAR